MAEGEIESAFDVAMRLGCDRDLRSTLARAIEKSQPRDAIALHEVEVDELIDRKRRQDYQAAAALLERVHRLYAACDAESEWTTYLAAVVATHKAKSSLIGILRERGVAKACDTGCRWKSCRAVRRRYLELNPNRGALPCEAGKR